MKIYTFFLPTRVECGAGVSQKTGEIVKEMSGSKVFIVTDKGIRQANLLESIEQSFCHEIQSAGVSGKDERYC